MPRSFGINNVARGQRYPEKAKRQPVKRKTRRQKKRGKRLILESHPIFLTAACVKGEIKQE